MNGLNVRVAPEQAGRTVHVFLRRELRLSAAKIRSVKFDPGALLLNGAPVKTDHVLQAGDLLTVRLDDSRNRAARILPNPMPLKILYEDRDVLVLDKPAGTVCHPSKGHLTDSLANGVRAYFDKTEKSSNIHFIGRLDKETSGVVIIAKNGVAADRMRQALETEDLVKEYLAICVGKPEAEAFTIDLPMTPAADPGTGLLRMTEAEADTDPKTKARTHVRVLLSDKDLSLLRIRLSTGRTHQIRFHLSAAGHPLLGDAFYGDPDPGMPRTALHAVRITFRHPMTGEILRCSAPVPPDMLDVLRKAGMAAEADNFFRDAPPFDLNEMQTPLL